MRVNGLYGHIRRNNAKSLALFLIFVFLAELLALGLAATIAAEGAWGSTASISPFRLMTLAASAAGTGLGFYQICGYLFWLLMAWIFYQPILRRSLSAAPLRREQSPELYDQVETLAIAAGLPMPEIIVMSSPACNAFAFGLSPGMATIAVTRGLLTTLNANELEAVLAHEMTHIRNRDTRLMAIATLCTAIIFRVAWVNVAIYLQPSTMWLFLPMFAAKFFWAILVLVGWSCIAAGACVVMTRLAISHAREFLADAGAVELTKNPKALISALRKIEGRDEVEDADFATQAAMISPRGRRLFSTHPSLGARAAALNRTVPHLLQTEASSAGLASRPVAPRISAAPNAFRAAHGTLATSVAEPVGSGLDFANPWLDRFRDLSVLTQPAFWRALREELAAIKPPTWVSHPYILVPAVLLNFAFFFGCESLGLLPPITQIPLISQTAEVTAPQTHEVPRLPARNPPQFNHIPLR